ncbi:MAG TPA: hypothetical protein VGQ19_02080 [Burkholderiales bacterium]|nr:hypothetical protein [Burkholderiales bacterium]
MRRRVLAIIFVAATLTACEKSKSPTPQSGSAPDTHPVKNVESLPSGTIREGARTMNTGAELGSTLEQQKQERDEKIESETK